MVTLTSYYVSQKYAPFGQTPSSLFNPQIIFLAYKRLVSSVSFGLALSLIVFINTHTHTQEKLLYPRLLATAKAFVARIGNASLREVVLCHYDDASCFDASRLSINKSTRSEKLPFFQKPLTVDLALVLIKIARKEGGGICVRQIEYASKRLIPTFAFCSVQKGTYGICAKMHYAYACIH